MDGCSATSAPHVQADAFLQGAAPVAVLVIARLLRSGLPLDKNSSPCVLQVTRWSPCRRHSR